MLHIQIDAHSGVPVYRQVMDQIKYYAASGALAAGAQLPSIRELAKLLSVNPTTVVKAYTELQHAGIIAMKHGKGAFVAERNATLTHAERRKVLERLTRQMTVEARQVGASAELVRRIVDEQLIAMGFSENNED